MKYFVILFMLFVSIAEAQLEQSFNKMTLPHEPFHIIGNVYYVGASDVTSFLITSGEGHILLDGGFVETAPMILANIEKLGFNPKDIKTLLISQAHFDHAGGLAEIKKQTGAQMIASKEDGILLESGGKGDYYFGDKYTFPPVSVDRVINDQESVRSGNVLLKAIVTPGHTKGCTSWTLTVHENSKPYQVVFLCGLTILPGTSLIKNEKYPDIARDFQTSYQKLKSLPCDVFLGAHGVYFQMEKKYLQGKADPAINPFIGIDELKIYVDEKENEFRKLLSEQQQNH